MKANIENHQTIFAKSEDVVGYKLISGKVCYQVITELTQSDTLLPVKHKRSYQNWSDKDRETSEEDFEVVGDTTLEISDKGFYQFISLFTHMWFDMKQ